MEIRYNPVLGWVFLAAGAVVTFLQAWLFLLGVFSPLIVVGLIVLVLGGLYLRRPYFRVEPEAIVVVSLAGTAQRRIPIPRNDDPRVEGNRIVIGERQVPVRKGMAHPEDWAAYTATLPRDPR
ncbi:hypothetical protein ITP53_07275 [Nonomuraea sp. K274]|uniref:Uncharacterized protein n=1 Tax=Nonomuraea cypriaca TaxID=1187855 RepID=A0A931EWT2_9ACTN|nr:hypothetical protein [Nonomuraea cypriaca]MBF8185540.1 hypothetical protein [Nonomuraea cypriaca]